MWWRRSWFSLNGTIGIQGQERGRSPTPLSSSAPANRSVHHADACRSAWPIPVDGHHHRSNGTVLEPHRLETKTEIAASDPTMAFELGGDALDGGRRDHEDAPARPEHRHPDRTAGRIKRETAFRAPSERSIELDPGIDPAAAQAVPGWAGRGHDAERGGGPALVCPDH